MALEVPDIGYTLTIGVALRRAAEQFGDADFIVMPDRRLTFAEAEDRSRALAKAMLAGGIGKGTRVGLFFTYGPEFVVSWLAAMRIGAVVMPFSTIYRPAELRTVLRIGDVHTLLAPSTLLGREVAAYLEEVVPGLAVCDAGPFLLPDMPYLRSIRMIGDDLPQWARGLSVTTAAKDVPVDDRVLEAVEADVVPGDAA